MTEFFNFTQRSKNITLGLLGVGALFIILALLTGVDSHRIWSSFVVANWYFFALALGGMVIIAISYISKSGWNTVLKRIPEAMMAYIPWGALVFGIPFLIYMGLTYTDTIHHNIYHWTADNLDEILQGKKPYLNIPFFIIRLIVVLVVWTIFARIFRKNSLNEDQYGGLKWFNKALVHSAIFLIVFAITVSIASWDWMMTLEPHWFSTMYSVYAFAGIFIGGWAVLTLTTLQLKNNGYLSKVTDEHYHDLGKYLFAFSVFWGYIWLSQFLLIWYANLPEEVSHFYVRTQGAWQPIFIANVLLNFAIPFFLLMMTTAKRNPKMLTLAAIVILVGRFVDVYQLVMPGALGTNPLPTFGLPEVGFMLLYGGIFLYVFKTALSNANLIPKNHPLIDESLHHEVT